MPKILQQQSNVILDLVFYQHEIETFLINVSVKSHKNIQKVCAEHRTNIFHFFPYNSHLLKPDLYFYSYV